MLTLKELKPDVQRCPVLGGLLKAGHETALNVLQFRAVFTACRGNPGVKRKTKNLPDTSCTPRIFYIRFICIMSNIIWAPTPTGNKLNI
jgi:hypothetical protein